MSEQIQQDIEQQRNIDLSAFIDSEQSDVETSQIIDDLLSDPEYKEKYARTQLINDYLQEQVQQELSFSDLRENISLSLESLPAHFSNDAVHLDTLTTEVVSQNSWLQSFFKKSRENKLLSGLSVAASVMFVTLFTLQGFNGGALVDDSKSSSIANKSLQISTPLLIQSASMLPVSFVSTSSMIPASNSLVLDLNQSNKQKYEWVEADPVLSKQVRQYINEHERRHAGYNLQPKIRTATYQVGE